MSLVALKLEKDGFEHFRCDKPISMGAFSVPDGLWMLWQLLPRLVLRKAHAYNDVRLQASTSKGCRRS